jgi:CheY-like chemotaxis protein
MSPLRRILLVEDSPRDAELILHAFGGGNLANEVVHVRDGAEALDYLYRRGAFVERSDDDPALMLLDLKLPKVDGLEVLRQIKSDATLKMIPIVMMTSSRQEQDLVRSYEAVKQVQRFWGVINELPESPIRGELVADV